VRDNLVAINPDATGAWNSYTPTLTQNAVAVAKTVGYAKYKQTGKNLEGTVVMTPTAAGTTTTVINSSLPVAPVAVNPVIGPFWYLAAAGTRYEGVAIWTGGLVYFQHATAANWFGIAPAFAIANGDTFTFKFNYEVA
jgi:hypothetical protein